MNHRAFPRGLTRDDLLVWYRANRARTRAIFELIREDAYYARPIPLRNPIVFYEGHFPAFSLNTLVKLALGKPGIDERLEVLFARGIDPEDEAKVKNASDGWPSRAEVQQFAAQCDAAVEDAILNATLEDPAVPALRGGEAVLTILEHEQMHHETLLYMLHNLRDGEKASSSDLAASVREMNVPEARPHSVTIPAGRATLGEVRGVAFGWDNEFPQHTVDVDAFTIDAYNVTNGQFLEYMEATGAKAPHFWRRGAKEWFLRGLLETMRLPLDSPVYVTHEQATAYARWKGKRLPTEAEFDRATYSTPSGAERLQPWGDEGPDASRGNFDFAHFDPVPVGSYAPNAWGLYDLVGNGWEWTSTIFDGFEGFEAMPSYPLYSADFFDGAHYVMKGASPVTARELVRRSFRNWFRPAYPYMYATFRCVD